MTDYAALPIDAVSRAALAADDLELRLVDPTDAPAVKRWLQADARGFHDAAPSEESLAAQAMEVAGDRITAVLDPAAADFATPVATVRCWPMDVTVPGGSLSAWAISSVTVAPTHRRRGIARALLTAELRTADRLGLPLAMLTVSEATIYARYGFGPAAYQAGYVIDTTRARWAGPVPTGRLHLVAPESLLADGPLVFARSRVLAGATGEVDRREVWWRQALGLTPTIPGAPGLTLRAVRFDDADGTPQGFALYRVALGQNAYPARLDLTDLVAATDDAYAALWRFLLEMDLVSEITAPLRSVAEPVRWQVADPRALRKTAERDHLWLRILNLPVVLGRRRYAAPGTFHLTVSDDLGFADGEFLLTVDENGRGDAQPATRSTASDAVRVSLSAADLASVYLSGTSAVTLARSGRLREGSTDAAAHLDAAFHTAQPPHLSTWF
ncbi:GNAT family N-acetyltransferase [Cryobacterium algoritolerans]|uniref:GNAT family N-acetyltransferase n=1 Tax=Cryobacterium algoritolerans TaxID=1259184 RepID=A0A4R8WU74_9MICO|nr:GNAT family N-acetyltransferase [Cryobacterium algoritolerans]TFC16361.1 GNAT family N-acetyltransferase [Cryobacterium algoritolerans]